MRILPLEVVQAVRARNLAVATSYATVAVRGYQPVFPLISSTYRADLNTGGIIAVHARTRHGPRAHMGIRSLFKSKYIHPHHALGSIVFYLASLHTGATAKAP
jgi:hypothetical protein